MQYIFTLVRLLTLISKSIIIYNMTKYGLNERIAGGLKIRQTPSSKTRVNGLMSSWWLEMSTVTNGLL